MLMKTILYTCLFTIFCALQGLGQCAGSIVFNSQKTGAFLPQSNAFYTATNGGFTWECWFMLDQPLGTEVRPLIVATDAVVYEDIWLGFGWNGGLFNQLPSKLVFKVDGPNSAVPNVPGCVYEPSGGFQTGVWYHVAATMDYTLHLSSLYVNGQLVASQATNVFPISRIVPTSLSCPLVENGQLTLNGKMDEVRIWNKPFTAAEVLAGYNHCLSGLENSLTMYYRCNDGPGSSIVADGSPNLNNATFSPTEGSMWSDANAPLADMGCVPQCDCAELDAGPDVLICAGDSVLLTPTPGREYYVWWPNGTAGMGWMQDMMVAPTVTTTYTLQSAVLGPELIVNGNFSQGNTGFTNGYLYDINYSPCNYYVGNQYFNVTNPSYTDHTGNGDNMMMSIDGCSGNQNLWEQTVPVLPNGNYVFEFWATRAAQVQPTFQVLIYGDVTGLILGQNWTGLPSTGIWMWDSYFSSFNAGTNHSITIKVLNLETDVFGNDFAMDDFSLKLHCVDLDQVTVYVDAMPVDLGPDAEICSGTSLLLTAGNGFTSYLWSDGSTGSTLTVNTSGTYWVTTSSSCGGVQSDTVHVSLVNLPPLNLGNDVSICPGDTAHFAPMTGTFSAYQWSGAGLSCISCVNPVAFPSVPTVYHLTAITAEGCSVSDSVAVNVMALPQVDLGNDLFICAGDSVQLHNVVPLTNYLWAPALNCGSCTDPDVSPLVSTTYFLSSSNALGCTVSDSVRIHVSPRPVLDLGNDLAICKGESVAIAFVPDPLFVSFQWTPASGLSCTNCAHPFADPSDSSIYHLQAVTAQGCIATDTIAVFVRNDLPQNVMLLITDASCESGGTVAIEAVGNGTDVLQYDFNGQGFSANPLYQQVAPGNYLLAVRNGEEGCPYRTVAVVGGEQSVVFIPNAFTPDGNENNNTWGIAGTCVAEITCHVFNRWGEEVAVLTDLSQQWDGTYGGNMVPDGIYTYQAEVTYISQYREVITGFVAILR